MSKNIVPVFCIIFTMLMSPLNAEKKKELGIIIFNLDIATSFKNIETGERINNWLYKYLRKKSVLEPVEKEKLKEILQEHDLEGRLRGVIDEETRIEIGRLLGAKYSLFGKVFQLRKSAEIHVRIVDNETRKIVASDAVHWNPNKEMNLEIMIRDLAKKLLDQLINIDEKNASLLIETKPVGSNVFVNGELIGEAPKTIAFIKLGESVSIKIEKKGYYPEEKRLIVTNRYHIVRFNLMYRRNEFLVGLSDRYRSTPKTVGWYIDQNYTIIGDPVRDRHNMTMGVFGYSIEIPLQFLGYDRIIPFYSFETVNSFFRSYIDYYKDKEYGLYYCFGKIRRIGELSIGLAIKTRSYSFWTTSEEICPAVFGSRYYLGILNWRPKQWLDFDIKIGLLADGDVFGHVYQENHFIECYSYPAEDGVWLNLNANFNILMLKIPLIISFIFEYTNIDYNIISEKVFNFSIGAKLDVVSLLRLFIGNDKN